MKILVYDIAADSGGALSILNQFYTSVINHSNDNVEWYFILGTATLPKHKNINILNYPWIKKSWFHRLYFDNNIAPNIIQQIKPDKIFSLQNICLNNIDKNIQQIVYLHQSLPFENFKFKPNSKEEFKYWIYQNIISKKIISSLEKSYLTICQSDWLKQKCVEKFNINQDKIIVAKPSINIEPKYRFKTIEGNFRSFFYPASDEIYKNHIAIINACKKLKFHDIDNYQVIFTLDKNNPKSSELYSICKKYQLPIHFVGTRPKQDIYHLYSRSVLLFPSYIESFGLPLLEAKLCNSPIICSDKEFSREILSNYNHAKFFDPFNHNELFNLMRRCINLRLFNMNNFNHYENTPSNNVDSWKEVINIIIDK